MTMHGMLWRFPETFAADNTRGIAPRSSHLKVIGALWKFNRLKRPFDQRIGIDARIGKPLVDDPLLSVLDPLADDIDHIVAKDALEKWFVILFGIRIHFFCITKCLCQTGARQSWHPNSTSSFKRFR